MGLYHDMSNDKNRGCLGVYRGLYHPVVWGLFHKPLFFYGSRHQNKQKIPL